MRLAKVSAENQLHFLIVRRDQLDAGMGNPGPAMDVASIDPIEFPEPIKSKISRDTVGPLVERLALRHGLPFGHLLLSLVGRKLERRP